MIPYINTGYVRPPFQPYFFRNKITPFYFNLLKIKIKFAIAEIAKRNRSFLLVINFGHHIPEEEFPLEENLKSG